jgi:hypothetical protein
MRSGVRAAGTSVGGFRGILSVVLNLGRLPDLADLLGADNSFGGGKRL